jgi:suppressor of fused-like protein
MADATQRGPGLDALEAYVDRVDGGPPSHHFFPRNPSSFRKGGPLHAVTVHALGAPDHWHLVTYGMSELFAKESADAGVSGWGFELTLRLDRPDAEAPTWASDFLASLAAYVWQSGHDFAYGDHIDLRGPLLLGSETRIEAAAIAFDPALTTLRGPLGRVDFLQVVGLTTEELELCRAWRTTAVLDLLAATDPLLITHLERPSLLDDPAIRELAEAGIAAEGSSLDELRVGTLRMIKHGRRRPRVTLQLGAGAATGLGPALRRKLNRSGASFRVTGDTDELEFVVAEAAQWTLTGNRVTVEVPLAGVDDLAGLFTARPGSRELGDLPGLRFVVMS